MNYGVLIVLAFVFVTSLTFKLIAALIIARKNVSNTKAKYIYKLFSFNPLEIFKRN